MKKLLAIYFTIFISIMFLQGKVQAQCNPADFSKTCVGEIQDGFIFIKSFNIDGKNGEKEKLEYSYIFAKDTEYYMNICTSKENSDGIIVTIYDSKRKKVVSNYANGSFYPGIIFQCNSTGIYYITYTFEGSETYCGGSVLAFKKM